MDIKSIFFKTNRNNKIKGNEDVKEIKTFDEELRNKYKNHWSYIDIESTDVDVLKIAQKYTMTSPERMLSLIQSVNYTIQNNIEGDFVECGVWKGGMMMIVALILKRLGVTDRKLYLYDTFEGMSLPGVEDRDVLGVGALAEYENNIDKENNINLWCYSNLEEVKQNLYSTGYPKENIIFVKGKVEDTIPATIPDSIAVLRLDTDWFESTYHEMVHLFPLLTKKGILIIDDFGHWQGARKAVEQYLSESSTNLFFNRIDYSCRSAQKI